MDERGSAANRVLACCGIAWLTAGLLLLAATPLHGSAATTLATLVALLLVPGFLSAVALGLHSTWHSPWSGVATSTLLGAGIVLPLAWGLRAYGSPLESGTTLLVMLGLVPCAAIALRARSGALAGFAGLEGRGVLEWSADAFVAVAAAMLAAIFAVWIEPATPGGDLWYYLSYIDWMSEHPGELYFPHTADPEEWNPRLQSSGFLAFQAMLSQLVRVDASALEVFWSWLPLGLIVLALASSYALAVSLGAGALTRIVLIAVQVAIVLATLPYVFDRETSGSRWPATVWLFRTSQDKVFLATVLAPAVAMLAVEWLARGERRWLIALFVGGLACLATHPLGLPFFAMVSLPYAVLSAAVGATSWRRTGMLGLLLLPLLAGPLSQRASEGVPNTLADNAAFIRRAHLTVDSLSIQSREANRYTAHPSLIAHPLLIAGIGAGLGLALASRRRADARFAFTTTAAPLIMLYTPGIAPLAGSIVTPYLLWRFTWLLPFALSLAVTATSVATLVATKVATETRDAASGVGGAGALAAAALALTVALATGLPGDLGRIPETWRSLGTSTPRASEAASWIEPIQQRVGGDTVLLDPSIQPYAIALADGTQTGYWRWGSNPALYARVLQFFNAPVVSAEHWALLRELDVFWVGVSGHFPIGEALRLRSEQFALEAMHGNIALYRVLSLDVTDRDDPIDYWSERAAAQAGSGIEYGRLALALAVAGRSDEARAQLELARERGIRDSAAHELFGTLLLSAGEYTAARDEFERSLELDATRILALNNLAWLLATTPDPALRAPGTALNYAERLLDLGGSDAASLDTVAATYAAAGHFERAIEYASRALLIYESGGAQGMARQVRARLDGYRNAQPYIDVAD